MTTANQKAFNKAYRGLKKQGFEQSLNEDGETCMYRGIDGRRCAAGWIIPDSKYHKGMEFHVVAALDTSLFGGADEGFVEELQSAHDISDCPSDMRKRLVSLADRRGLTVPA